MTSSPPANNPLTNLYNGLVTFRAHKGPAFDRAAFDQSTRRSVSPAEIEELDDIHRALDAAVLRAYGWPEGLSDEQILERLLALNLERAGGGSAGEQGGRGEGDESRRAESASSDSDE